MRTHHILDAPPLFQVVPIGKNIPPELSSSLSHCRSNSNQVMSLLVHLCSFPTAPGVMSKLQDSLPPKSPRVLSSLYPTYSSHAPGPICSEVCIPCHHSITGHVLSLRFSDEQSPSHSLRLGSKPISSGSLAISPIGFRVSGFHSPSFSGTSPFSL